jgi:hypothetical protein
MSGKYLYYELATPTIDASTKLPPTEIEYESNGTLTVDSPTAPTLTLEFAVKDWSK